MHAGGCGTRASRHAAAPHLGVVQCVRRRCNDGTVAGQAECVGNYTVVTDHGNVTVEREWSNVFPNFDNVGSSLLICFITATLNGYTDTMIQVRLLVRNVHQRRHRQQQHSPWVPTA